MAADRQRCGREFRRAAVKWRRTQNRRPVLNVTVPVGVPEALGATVAENVTDCPKAEGFNEEVIVVVVGKRKYSAER